MRQHVLWICTKGVGSAICWWYPVHIAKVQTSNDQDRGFYVFICSWQTCLGKFGKPKGIIVAAYVKNYNVDMNRERLYRKWFMVSGAHRKSFQPQMIKTVFSMYTSAASKQLSGNSAGKKDNN